MRIYSKLACFIGGVLFGSVGIKLLSSKDAKKAYTHITAAGLRMKDSAMKTVATVQENAGDNGWTYKSNPQGEWRTWRCEKRRRGKGRRKVSLIC